MNLLGNNNHDSVLAIILSITNYLHNYNTTASIQDTDVLYTIITSCLYIVCTEYMYLLLFNLTSTFTLCLHPVKYEVYYVNK